MKQKMDEFTPYQIKAALEEEKLYLEELLETETDEFERQTSKDRITEIDTYFAQHVKPTEPKPQIEIIAFSEEKNPAQLLKVEIQKRQKGFLSLYNHFKAEVKNVTLELKEECSETDWEKHALTIKKMESDLKAEYDFLCQRTTVCQDLKLKMDSCNIKTAGIVALLNWRSAQSRKTEEIENQRHLEVIETDQSDMLERIETQKDFGAADAQDGHVEEKDTLLHMNVSSEDVELVQVSESLKGDEVSTPHVLEPAPLPSKVKLEEAPCCTVETTASEPPTPAATDVESQEKAIINSGPCTKDQPSLREPGRVDADGRGGKAIHGGGSTGEKKLGRFSSCSGSGPMSGDQSMVAGQMEAEVL